MSDVKINDLSAAGGGVTDSMQFETDIAGTTSNKVTAAQIKTYAQTGIDHGSINGLADNDHNQYALRDGSNWASGTASRVVILNSGSTIATSSVTSIELGHLSGVTSGIQTQLDTKYDSDNDIDHGGINGLSDDDHTQYSLANGTRWTTTPTASRAVISDGSGNLVVSSVTSTELGYSSGVTSAIQTQLDAKYDTATDVDHDATTNFVANEHIDHTSVTLTAGEGLSGGGTIASNRTFDLDVGSLTTAAVDAAADYFVFLDATDGVHKKVLGEDLPGGGGGGATDFTDLGDVPSSYTGHSLKLVRVNTGETALEFVDPDSLDVIVPSGSTLPASPSEGQLFLHTPTGRKWLMMYANSEWNTMQAYGDSTLYVSASGTSDFNDGHSSGTAWDIEFICPLLPGFRTGNIDLIMATGTFTEGTNISIPPGLAGSGKIRFYGNTTTQVASTTYSSGSDPYQSWTMSATVSAGSEGDAVVYVSGTNPGTNGTVNSTADVWCLLSRSGTNLQIAGGITSNVAPDNTSTFSILSRNTNFILQRPSNLDVQSVGVEFWYVNFRLSTNSSALNFVMGGTQVDFIGCGFNRVASSVNYFDGFGNCNFIGCYIENNDSGGVTFNLTNGAPGFVIRSLFKYANSSSSGNLFTIWGSKGNLVTTLMGNRFWNTSNGRIGRLYYNASVRFNIGGYTGSHTYLALGGSTYYGWDMVGLAVAISTAVRVTKVGTTAPVVQVDAASFCYST